MGPVLDGCIQEDDPVTLLDHIMELRMKKLDMVLHQFMGAALHFFLFSWAVQGDVFMRTGAPWRRRDPRRQAAGWDSVCTFGCRSLKPR